MRRSWMPAFLLGCALLAQAGCDVTVAPLPKSSAAGQLVPSVAPPGIIRVSPERPTFVTPAVNPPVANPGAPDPGAAAFAAPIATPPPSSLGGLPPPPDGTLPDPPPQTDAGPLAIPPRHFTDFPANLEVFRKGGTPILTRFGLRWIEAPGTQQFHIDRRIRIPGFPNTNLDWVEVGQADGDATSADVDLEVSNLLTVEFRVRAVGPLLFGESRTVSMFAGQRFSPGFAFPAPSNLTATGTAVGTLRLDWRDNHANEPETIVYQVEHLTAAGFAVIANLPPNRTTFTVTGLSGFHTFRVRSVPIGISAQLGTLSPSDYSNEVTAPAPAFAPGLAQPSGLVATPISGSRIDLRWTDNANNESRFIISMGTTPTALADIGIRFQNQNTFSATGLTPNTQYFFQVRARNENGDSGRTPIASATTLAADAPPAPPSDFVATAISSSVIELRWRDNADNEEEFVVDRSTNGGATFVEYFAGESAIFHRNPADPDLIIVTDEDLPAATPFCYRIRTRNGAATSAPSNTGCATTLAANATAVRVLNQTAYPIQSLVVNGAEQLAGNLVLLSGGSLTVLVAAGNVSVHARTSLFTSGGEIPMYNSDTTFAVPNGATVDLQVVNPSLDQLLTRFTGQAYTWEAFLQVGDLISIFSCIFHPNAGQNGGQYEYFINGERVETGTYSLNSYPGDGTVLFTLETSGTQALLAEVPDGFGHRHILMAGLDFED